MSQGQMEHIKKPAAQAILESIAKGMTVQGACKAANTGRTTLYRWRKEDEKFAAAFDEAREAAIEVVEDALFAAALKGNPTCLIFFLCNRAPDRWKHVNRTEITGADGQPVAFSFADLVAGIENGQSQAAPERKVSDRKV